VRDRYLLDTNHLSAAIIPVSNLRDRIQQARRKGVRFGTCTPALCDLEAGIQNSARQESLYRQLNTLLKQVRLWPVDRWVARLYGGIYLDLVRRGRMLSHVDIVLASLATDFSATLLTADRDFEALPDIRTENWLT
jgi:tRNA(fMet)-specific endonuclease VapC